ncbi:MAG: hypothetical protein ACT4QE_23105 [Anaerolineales bacterium]
MPSWLEITLRILAFFIGVWLVFSAVLSALRTFVLPRSAPDGITRVVFRLIRYLFHLRVKRLRTYEEKDRVLAVYAPVSLLALPPVWMGVMCLGYTALFWAAACNRRLTPSSKAAHRY